MSTETEVKVRIADVKDFCRRLRGLNPAILSERHFEDNHLLDFSDRRLAADHCLLRIRFAAGRHFFTYKGPPRPEGIFKTREELETSVQDGAILLQALARIGLGICFRYQKYRQEFLLGDVQVAVDETPIGSYVELEGTEVAIRALAAIMGIPETQFLRCSYYSLYADYCREKGEPPGFMVFECGT